jgi:muramidase (phage lysozyme)
MSRERNTRLLTATLIAALISPKVCVSQDCVALRSASAADAVSALDHGEIQTASCSWAAFQLIEHLPPEEAIAILIKHLAYKRPSSNELHGPRPYAPYPAVESLYDVGLAAEPALIDFVAQHEDDSSVERRNALEALALIRHGDVVPTIKLMRERSASLIGTAAATRLDSASQYLLKRYCSGKLQWCEKRLRESEPEK